MDPKKILIGVGAAVVIAAVIWFLMGSTTLAAVGNLNIYNGTVNVARGQTQIAGQTGTEINASDIIKVSADGRASVIFKDGTVVRLAAGSVFSVSDVVYKNGKISHAKLELEGGKAWSNVATLDAGGSFEVETPTLVATVRGTVFDVWYENGRSQVRVSSHVVDVALRANPTDKKPVTEGNIFVVDDKTAGTDFEKGPAKVGVAPEDWTKFNQGEDVTVKRVVTETTAPVNQTTDKAVETVADTSSKPPTTSNTNVQTTGSGGATAASTLAVTSKQSLASVTEGDTVAFTATLTMPDGTKKVVTDGVSWQVVGYIGSISRTGVFTAKLDASVAEFGQASGAIVATWKDPATGQIIFDKTTIFTVNAAVTPVTGVLQG